MDDYHTWDVGSVWHKRWPRFMYIGQWHIFHGPVIMPYILKTICWTKAIIGILVPCDAKAYLIKCMWVSDLHFMVQWFCLISWRHFDRLMLYQRYWFSVTQTIYVGQRSNISWSSDFAWYLDYLMDNVIIGILYPRDATIYQIKCMWVSDLNFMVQWFCLLSWRLLDELMLYWRY